MFGDGQIILSETKFSSFPTLRIPAIDLLLMTFRCLTCTPPTFKILWTTVMITT